MTPCTGCTRRAARPSLLSLVAARSCAGVHAIQAGVGVPGEGHEGRVTVARQAGVHPRRVPPSTWPWTWNTDWPASAPVGLSIAALAALLGTLVERWLFFAQARHVVALYY